MTQLSTNQNTPIKLLLLLFATSITLLLGSAIGGPPSSSSFPLGSQISVLENKLWSSPDGIFSLGFLPDSQKDDEGSFVVGIWHYFYSSSDRRVPVWTVGGGGVRVCDNSTFGLSSEGSLVLSDWTHHGFRVVWSSDTDNLGVSSAILMDNGNLVLVGYGGKIIWASFDFPTDTLLPGQPFRYPQTLQATSPNSVASYYSFKIKSFAEISLVWEDNVTYWTSHLSSSRLVMEARLEPDGRFGLFDYEGGILWDRLSADFKDPLVKFRRLRIDVDGNLRIYSWDNATSLWKVGWQAVQNQCGVFASCGLYSVCGYNSSGPVCGCLNPDSVSGKCEKMPDLENCDKGLSMRTLKQTVLYSLYPPHDVDIMLGVDACREYCSNDSSCFASTALNDGSGLCTIKRTSFISGYRYSSTHAISFMKVCLVPEAVSAQAANLRQQPQRLPMNEIVGRQKGYKVAVVVLLLITGFAFLIVEMAVFWVVMYKRRKITTTMLKRNPFRRDVGLNPHYSALVRLSLEEVKVMTKNFATRLGTNVYRGVLPNKIMVTVKVLDNAVAPEREFQLVALILGSTHHRNLVAVKGFCYESKHRLLMYEYISNCCSLDEWLLCKSQNRKNGWKERINIAIGIARALAYLHLQCKKCIVHGKLKLESVLLDENLTPKLTDFGLGGLLKEDVASSSETLPERDVYMFGMILLQIVAGKREGSEINLCELAYEFCESGGLDEFVDAQLRGKAEVEEMQRVVKLALWCVQNNPSLRPLIAEVLMVLEGALSLDMPPSIKASKVEEDRSGDANLDIVEAESD